MHSLSKISQYGTYRLFPRVHRSSPSGLSSGSLTRIPPPILPLLFLHWTSLAAISTNIGSIGTSSSIALFCSWGATILVNVLFLFLKSQIMLTIPLLACRDSLSIPTLDGFSFVDRFHCSLIISNVRMVSVWFIDSTVGLYGFFY